MLLPPESVRDQFLSAGWCPERVVAVPEHVRRDHPAAQILRQFNGLTVGHCGAGRRFASSGVVFGPPDVEGNDEEIRVWERLLDTSLVRVAGVHHGHGELFVDGMYRFFGRSLMHDAFYLEGLDFASAMETLLLGLGSRPMLRPDQDSVGLYGVEFTRDNPEVFHYPR